jgi:nickel-dependent lactate racemase
MVEELGKTTYGTAIEVSKPFLEGEVRIIIGEFHPDPLTGFKGPHSVILPQLSGFKTLEMGRRLYYQSLTGPGVIGGNPLLIDSQEAARLTGVDASLLLVTDHKGSVIDLLYGDVEAVWERALTEYHDLYTVEVEGADVYVVSPGGGRFDFDLYHSLWALRGVEKLRRGARIILVAECGEGLGAPALSKLAGVERLSELRRRHMLGGEALHFLRSTQRGVEILFVSALPRHLAEPLGLKAYPAANDALDAAGRGKVIILPYGLSIIPTRER